VAVITTLIFKVNSVILALTPVERWQAARKFSNSSTIMAEKWFFVAGIIAIAILIALLYWVSVKENRQERRSSGQLFEESARRAGLSDRERRLLLNIAHRARLKRNESVFTMSSAFDRGMAKVIEEMSLTQTAEEVDLLKTEFTYLREKLGFRKLSRVRGSVAKDDKVNSREIQVGKKLQITRRKSHSPKDIEVVVVKNTNSGLSVKLAEPMRIEFGEVWCVRYHFGSSVWEFDTSVISYDGSTLVLKHSDKIRFVNRRRFLRVPVRRPAFVAAFPFSRTFSENIDETVELMEEELRQGWGPPVFVPAIITELGGPGLRIEVNLEIKEGERILVVFNLDKKSAPGRASEREGVKTVTSRVMEDIAQVRHVRKIKNGVSIGVELTGLSDSDCNMLVNATNAASLQNKNGAVKANSARAVAARGV